jgi:hypothetical protein
MNRGFWLLGLAPWAVCTTAHAQTPMRQTPASQIGVLVFSPAFFADARPDTALDMVGRLPGFSVVLGDSSTRGLAGSAGNVLIDGARPSSKSDGLDQILRRISAGNVERIELIRGGAPGIDMHGQAVIANVVLKRNVQVERVIEATTYVYDDGFVGPLIKGQYSRREGETRIEGALSATTDRGGGTEHGSRLQFDPLGAPLQAADLAVRDKVVTITGTGSLQRPWAGGKLQLNLSATRQTSATDQSIYIRSGTGDDEFTRERSANTNGEVGGEWSRAFGPRTELVLTGLDRLTHDNYRGLSASGGSSANFGVASSSGETVGRAALTFRPNDRWSHEGGGEVAYNFLDSATTYAENGVAIPLPNAAVRVAELRGEVFGQTTWKPSPRLTVEAGLRVELSRIGQTGDTNQSKSFIYSKPRLQLTWTPAEGHQFRLGVRREVGQLDFGQFVASSEITLGSVLGGNPDLEPQKTTTYDLVYERRFWEKGTVIVTLSHTDVQDVIDVIPLAGGFEGVGNVGNGTEDFLQTSFTLPLDHLGITGGRLSARTAWRKNSVIDPLTGQARRFSGSGEFGCGVSYDQDLAGGRWAFGLQHGCNVDHSVNYHVDEVRSFTSEPFVLVYGQWKPSRGLTLRVDVGDITNHDMQSSRAFYSGPRNSSPLDLTEVRRARSGRWVYLQLRKAL